MAILKRRNWRGLGGTANGGKKGHLRGGYQEITDYKVEEKRRIHTKNHPKKKTKEPKQTLKEIENGGLSRKRGKKVRKKETQRTSNSLLRCSKGKIKCNRLSREPDSIPNERDEKGLNQ